MAPAPAPAPGKMCRLRAAPAPAPDTGVGEIFCFFSVCFRNMAMSPSQDIQNLIDSNNITSQISLSVINKQSGACEVVLTAEEPPR